MPIVLIILLLAFLIYFVFFDTSSDSIVVEPTPTTTTVDVCQKLNDKINEAIENNAGPNYTKYLLDLKAKYCDGGAITDRPLP